MPRSRFNRSRSCSTTAGTETSSAEVGSIRKAAETLLLTSTALNRRILAMEEELGAPIFERLR